MKAETGIRPFRDSDATATAQLFFDSVHIGTQSHYDDSQRRVWAPRVPDAATWLDRLAPQTVYVAERAGRIVGFMAMKADGCIDLVFVAPDAMGQGVGTALYDAVLAAAVRSKIPRLYAEASHLSRRFFERQGWSVVSPQTLLRDGVFIANFAMEKQLPGCD